MTSKLIVDPAQRREQLAAAVEQDRDVGADGRVPPALGARLHETALLLALRGKSDAARLATTAAALTLDRAWPRGQPVRLPLFDKVIKAPEEAEPAARASMVAVHVAHRRLEQAVAVFGARQVVEAAGALRHVAASSASGFRRSTASSSRSALYKR